MKVLVLAGLFLLIGFVSSNPVDEKKLQNLTEEDDDDLDLEDFKFIIKIAQEYVDKKCELGSAKSRNITEIVIEIDQCLDDHIPNRIDELKDIGKDSSSEEICADTEKTHKIRKCFQSAVDLVKDCSEKEEKYLPEFFFDGIENMYNYVCTNDGKNIEKLFQNSTLECIEVIANDDKFLEVCDDRIDSFGLNKNDTVLTKTDLCRGLMEGKLCYVSYINQKCPNDSNVRELFKGFMKAAIDPCKK